MGDPPWLCKIPATRRCLQRLNAASSRKAPPRICLASREWPKCSSNAVPSGTVALGRWKVDTVDTVIVNICQYQSYEKTILHQFTFTSIIELDYGKNYRKALYLTVKTMVSCRLSLNPIQWRSQGQTTRPPQPKDCPTTFFWDFTSRSNPNVTGMCRKLWVFCCFTCSFSFFWNHV